MAVGVDFRPRALHADERVVGRHAAVRRQAQHLAIDGVGALCRGDVARAERADRDIERAARPEEDARAAGAVHGLSDHKVLRAFQRHAVQSRAREHGGDE